MAIDSGDYTYDKLFHTRPVGEPWPEQADKRLEALEAQAIADDARIEKLEAHVKHLEAIIHKYINQGTEEPE